MTTLANLFRLQWTRLPRSTEQRTIQVGNADDLSAADQEYLRRLRKWNEQLAKINSRHLVLSASLLIMAITTCGVALASSFAWEFSVWPALATLAVFQLLRRNSGRHDYVCHLIGFYEGGLERLLGDWRGKGIAGEEFNNGPEHLYASDLDLFGKGSLFELLCTARTSVGRATLADWLLHSADMNEILSRQAAVRELRDQVDFREEWVSIGNGALGLAGSHSLKDWVKTPPSNFPILFKGLAVILPFSLLLFLMLAVLGVLGAHWYLPVCGMALLEATLTVCSPKAREIADNLTWPSYELSLLGPLLHRLESANFQCPLLQSLQSPLTHGATRASRQVQSLARWAWLIDLSRTEFAFFLAPLLIGTNLAVRVEVWRQRNQKELLRWLETLGQFEALLCLARHHFENPDWVFPVLETQTLPRFDAKLLGHPLLDSKTRVTCDLKIGGQSNQLLIVSGSNMSGKSTLLRSVGMNAVLALAGAPVCAKHLTISNLCIACSCAITDSLRDNKSRFQAEVERLKQVLNAASARSTLFLIDEMLGGTNSKDRLFGATAVAGQLMDGGAIGLITTHDLALTEIAKKYNGRVANVHFEEHYMAGEMCFDYQMRPGVLIRTNGMNVMSALGLLSVPT